MWHRLAVFILRFRIVLLALLLAVTLVMGFYASKVQLGYEFTKAIPTDNPKLIDFQKFTREFHGDANTMVIGVKTDKFFEESFFRDYTALIHKIEKIKGVKSVIGVPTAVKLVKDTVTNQLKAISLTADPATANAQNVRAAIYNLPFYNGFLYNRDSSAYLMAIGVDSATVNSKNRSPLMDGITAAGDEFAKAQSVTLHYSGLPLIRTSMANKVQSELKMFLVLSLLLTAVILALFFRSWVAVVASMLVVGIAVIWSIGTLSILHLVALEGDPKSSEYTISLLTGLIPPLIVVIGIPNCVYFLNKYHTEFAKGISKRDALINMVDRMGIVTLFTNLTAAIGFGVFFFTKSAILKEFGLVAGINIIAIFFISLILLPSMFSLLPPPKAKHTSYMETGWMVKLLEALTRWTFNHRPAIYITTIVACVIAAIGIARLKSVAFIVDDLPKSDKVYQDLKFFERNFHGVMPLELVVDARKKYLATTPATLVKIDSLHEYLKGFSEIGHALAITEGIKFAVQAQLGGDSAAYSLPSVGLSSVGTMLRKRHTAAEDASNPFSKLLSSFIDSTGQKTRISINMADVGSVRLPILLDSIRQRTDQLFPKEKYTVTQTGTSITFLEGSRFIINSLRDSLILAFAMILVCMIVLFRSWRIVLIALLVNVVPLLITAGIMGWAGVPLKPSTVLVFSVALGITVDVTIRFLVNYKQEMQLHGEGIPETVRRTIFDTGLSIIYTSLILVAGFGVFCLSQFDGTKALGFLTSITLLLAMVTNLTLQPALLMWIDKQQKKKTRLKDNDGEVTPMP